jgi:hypothetical protein
MPDNPVSFAMQRIANVQANGERYGTWKINLVRSDTTEREGIWCVPVTEADHLKLKDDSSLGEKIRVYLANAPLPWGGRTWGAEIIGTTRGNQRPEALPDDQVPLDADAKLLWEGLRR